MFPDYIYCFIQDLIFVGNCTVLTVLLLPFLRYRRIGASIIFQLFQVNVTLDAAQLKFSIQLQQHILKSYFKKCGNKL